MAINGVEMVTDRTLSDVEIAKSLIKKGLQSMTEAEKQAFLLGLKGAYNYTDVNRVEGATRYIVDRLVAIPDELHAFANELDVEWLDLLDMPYDKADYENVITKQDWVAEDMFQSEDRQRYLDNIFFVFQALSKEYADVPTTLNGLTHKEANAIERRLGEFNDELITEEETRRTLIKQLSVQWVYYSGELFGGEV